MGNGLAIDNMSATDWPQTLEGWLSLIEAGKSSLGGSSITTRFKERKEAIKVHGKKLFNMVQDYYIYELNLRRNAKKHRADVLAQAAESMIKAGYYHYGVPYNRSGAWALVDGTMRFVVRET